MRNDPDYWRERATVVRSRASDIEDRAARRSLLEIAENYDQLAEQADALRKAYFPKLGKHAEIANGNEDRGDYPSNIPNGDLYDSIG